MSTNQRFVPVKLIAGKEYVLRNGRHVTVQENPHWQCRVNYPFAVIQGPDFVVYYGEEGNTGSGTAHEHDIMRPVYKAGEVYLNREGMRQVIGLDDNDPTYPLENEERDESWTRDGRVIHFTMSARQGDLMDYTPPLPVFHAADSIPVPPPAPVDPWIGKRVKFNHDGLSGYGKVIAKDEGAGDQYYAVEMEDAPLGCHTCRGLVPSGCGWSAPEWAMTLAPVTNLEVVDGVPAMPELAPIEALPSLVGLRVEVSLGDTIARGVVKYESDGLFAVELDADVQYPWLHDCGGRCKDGRGWWAPRDSLRTVGETPVEAERSESLTEADVVEVWAAYRINPSIDIDSWIAARLKLKAAVK